MNKRKLTVVTLTAIMLISAQSAPVLAASMESPNAKDVTGSSFMSLRWTDTTMVIPSISASGKKISVSIFIMPKSESEKSNGTLYLQKYDGSKWVSEKSWTISETGTVDITKTYTGTSNTKYRTKVVVTTGVDDITATSSEITL